MSLGRQIHALIKRHSAVFVKGLGTFRRVRTSASFDAKRKVVLPPISYVEFEHNTEEGYDYTLYVQQSQQLDRSAAENFVKQETDKLAENIHREGQANLEELGQLVAYGYSFIFKPIDLSGFQFMPLEDPFREAESTESSDTIEDEVAPIVVDEPVEEEEVIVDASQAEEIIVEDSLVESPSQPVAEEIIPPIAAEPIINDPVAPAQPLLQEEEEEISPKKSNSMAYAVIGVIALLLLGGLYYFDVFKTNSSNNAAVATADTLVQDTRAQELDSALTAINDTLNTTAAADSIAPSSTGIKVMEENPNHKFAIVIGTHAKLVLAQEEAEEFNKKGHTHVRVLSPNLDKNLKKVIWDTYATKEQRDSALRYVQKNIKADAWPTVVK